MDCIKKFKFWLEVVECVMLVALLVVFVRFHIVCKNVKPPVKVIEKEELYRQIYNDQRILGLQRQNAMLNDSISVLNEEMDCGVKFIVVKDTVYICDTVYLTRRK